MVDNFISAGTQGDDEEELPSPYGTGPKNRTTEEHRRSDYDNDNWRERASGLGLDPSPSLPNAPRSYDRGPVPQQPYVPKPPFLPAVPPPPAQQPQQQRYGDQPSQNRAYPEQNRSYGEQPQRPEYYGDPARGEQVRGEQARGEQVRGEQPRGEGFRQQPAPQGPPPQQGRPNPFGPGSNGVPPNRQAQGPSGPPQQAPRPPQSSNGHAPGPHNSNGTSNWSPAQGAAPSHNNGLSPQQPPSQAPTPPPAQAPSEPQQHQNSRPAKESDNGYLSDPSAEYESNAPVNEPKPVGARRRAGVQQDAPSQVPNEQTVPHRAARRAQAAANAGPAGAGGSSTQGPSTTGNPAGGQSASSSEGVKRPRRYRVHHLRDMKNRGEKWAMLTAYDQYTAEIFDQAGIPVLLVGDSAANNVFGYESTLRVTVDELIPLCRAVAGAAERALVVADLPFGSYQASPEQAFHTAVRFMKEAGVHAVKLEGGRTVVPMVEKLTQSGIPVMAHIGFTPQSEHSIGGYRVQGRGEQAAGLIDDAIALAEAGAFSVVLEMVPGDVAAEITKRITIPTIGIGAGRDTDAQVLVWQDMAGLRSGPMPRFVKQYADLRGILTSAASTYAADVASGTFPADEHTF
jgi:3-methyl-2-oxobutanoate hydroxymethyltransferase